jgi:uncharacterized protein
LLESFVGAELRKLKGWSETGVTMSHFRTREGDKVDFILEDQRGRIVGIEVNASATLRRTDFSGLRKLEEAAGYKFFHGLILHDYHTPRPVSEKIAGVPIWVFGACSHISRQTSITLQTADPEPLPAQASML